MFANFTEETCTGTGNTQALAGATTGNIAFQESYANGDLIPYVIEDSGGAIKVAGVGTYVSASDDITRNDTWNWNGTAVDDSPSSNITLSGGTHTVRVSIFETSSDKVTFGHLDNNHAGAPVSNNISPRGYNGSDWHSASAPLTAGKVRIVWGEPVAEVATNGVAYKLTTLSSTSTARYYVGVYVLKEDSLIASLVWQSTEQDGSAASGSTGNKVLTGISATIKYSDIYGVAFFSNDSDIIVAGVTNKAAMRRFGTTQAYNHGHYATASDFTTTYATTMPSTVDPAAASSGDYRAPTAMLRKT